MGASGGEKFEYVNIHGAIYVETGRTHMLEAGRVNAVSTIELLRL